MHNRNDKKGNVFLLNNKVRFAIENLMNFFSVNCQSFKFYFLRVTPIDSL